MREMREARGPWVMLAKMFQNVDTQCQRPSHAIFSKGSGVISP